MNQTFSFPRFRTYFLYDLKQMWRRNSRAILLIGCASVIFYIIGVTFSLVFQQTWQAPSVAARAVVFGFAALALVLYQTRTYGYLTERRAGSSWLMIPASTTEKFVSMMIITLIVLPLAFFVVYMVTDALIVLLDPTASQPLISSITELSSQFSHLMEDSDSGIGISLTSMLFPMTIQLGTNLLFFLLCGICFKRWKLVSAFAILFGLQFLLISLSGLLAMNPDSLDWLKERMTDAESTAHTLNVIFGWANAVNVLILLGLGTGIFFRIKNLKH